MKNYLLLFALIGCCFSCKNKPKVPLSNPSSTTNTFPTLIPKLICTSTPDSETMLPKSELFLKLGNSKFKIGALLNCDNIAKADYSNYQIPASALAAGGGWWAGSGDYFYVVKEGENFIVKQGMMDAQMPADDYGYRTIAAFSNTGEPMFTKHQLTGTYSIGSHDAAYIFVLNLTDKKEWDATLYEIDGMLPPEEEIERFLADFKMTKFGKFDVNMDDLTFDSDFGKGKFEMTKGFESVIFKEKEWVTGAAFEMSKIGV